MNYDLKGIYEQSSQKVYERLVSETDRLQAATVSLVDSLVDEFEARYAEKWQRKKSQDSSQEPYPKS